MPHLYRLLVTLFLFGVSTISHAQDLVWAKQLVTNVSSAADDIVTDQDGNVYIVGTASGNPDFDLGTGTAYASDGPAYFAKYDSSGNFIWVKSLPGTRFIGIHLDPAGDLFLYGQFNDTIDFDFGPGVAYLSPQSNNQEIMVAKYDQNANFIWAKSMGSASNFGQEVDVANDLAIDSQGNIWVCGTFKGTGDFDPGPGIHLLSSYNVQTVNGFALKLDPSGNFLWAGKFESPQSGKMVRLAIDGNDNVYLFGSFYTSLDCDPDTTTTYNLTSSNSQAGFLIKLNSNGGFIWANLIDGAPVANFTPEDLTLSQSGTGLLFTGRLAGTVDLDPGTGTALISSVNNILNNPTWVRWDTAGNYVSGFTFGAPDSQDFATRLKLDINGDSYLFGSFQDSMDFDPSPSTAWGYGTANHLNGFIAKYDPSGNYITHATFGNEGTTIGNVWLWGAHIDNNFNIYITGDFQGVNDFDPGAGTTTITAGDEDIYFLKIGQTGLVGLQESINIATLQVFPNPANNHLTIQANSPGSARLIDLSGKTILQQTLTTENTQIDISTLPAGIYLLSVQFEDGRAISKKIVIGG